MNVWLRSRWMRLPARRRLRLRIATLAGMEYVATCAFLCIYWVFGKAGGTLVCAFIAYSVVVNSAVLSSIASGWSERLDDPSMTSVQMVVSCGRDLAGCLLMPGLWFIFALNLFIALPFGSLQFTNRTFAAFWLGTCLALGFVFMGYPERLQIGFDTATEKVILWLFMSAALGRLMIFNSRVSALRRKLRSRGAELVQAGKQIERENIARELHDTLLQSFYSLIWSLQAAAHDLPASSTVRGKLDAALENAESLVAAGREKLFGMREAPAARAPLRTVLRCAGQDLALHSQIDFHVSVSGSEESEAAMGEDARAGVEKILLEAISNAFRHSNGRNVWLVLDFMPTEFYAQVRDDGKGLEPVILVNGGRQRHFGISIMRERAEELGAAITITEPPAGGTLVTCRLAGSIAYG